MAARLRITYQRYGELRDDLVEMARGGLLVKVADLDGLELHAPVALELVLPDRTTHRADVAVLHAFPGVGVAVSVTPALVAGLRAATGADAGTGPARHERLPADAASAGSGTRAASATRAAPAAPAPAAAEEPPAPPPARARIATAAPPPIESLSNPEKMQLALHGNRDQRNAILRDANRTLHPFVLKNPQVTSEDVLAMIKNGQTSAELLRLIAERKEWSQRPQIALALARNVKTPTDVAIRALDFVPADALRQIAKGGGAPPPVIVAARKKVLR